MRQSTKVLSISGLLCCFALLAVTPTILASETATGPQTYTLFNEVESLYQSGMAAEDCERVKAISALLRELGNSREPLPQDIAEQMNTNRLDVGAYVRQVRRQLNKRAKDLCPIVPAPCEVEVEPVEEKGIDDIYQLTVDVKSCDIVAGAAQRMIAKSDAEVAGHTLKMLGRLRDEHPGCFPDSE